MNRRNIALVDMDAYFVECERLANPSLRGKPVVVVADKKRRCVVLTSSYEAREFGIRTGMLLHEARNLCRFVSVVEVHTPLYLYISGMIEDVLNGFSDKVEMFSVDEAYVDLTGIYGRNPSCAVGPAMDTAIRIKSAIHTQVGLPCSIGIAPNKILAKLLADQAKPSGIREVTPDAVQELLENTEADKLCGIGSRMMCALRILGVKTAADLGRIPVETLVHRFGVHGRTLHNWGRGIDSDVVCTEPVPVKSVGHSLTMPLNTAEPYIVYAYLLLLAEKVAARMRRYGFCGKIVHAVLRDENFVTYGKQKRIRTPTSDGKDIYSTAYKLVEGIWIRASVSPKSRIPVRLVGVSVSGLTPVGGQPELLPETYKRDAINVAVDRINARFGKNTLKPAAQLTAERFGVFETPIPPHKIV